MTGMSIYDQFTEQERTLLHDRARRFASAQAEVSPGDTATVLLVTLREETYALPIDTIVNIKDGIPVVPVPCAQPFVAGIANIRGHIIPVLDLATLLGVPGKQSQADILVQAVHEDMNVAFLVERVGETVSLSLAEMAPIPEIMDVDRVDYLQGTFADGTILLDMAAILADPSLEPDRVE
jgi:purine-binding chemotaxis protein CheW